MDRQFCSRFHAATWTPADLGQRGEVRVQARHGLVEDVRGDAKGRAHDRIEAIEGRQQEALMQFRQGKGGAVPEIG
jgi:hypothetical protein